MYIIIGNTMMVIYRVFNRYIRVTFYALKPIRNVHMTSVSNNYHKPLIFLSACNRNIFSPFLKEFIKNIIRSIRRCELYIFMYIQH